MVKCLKMAILFDSLETFIYIYIYIYIYNVIELDLLFSLAVSN